MYTYLLTYAHSSGWSTGHLRPLAIALCSELPRGKASASRGEDPRFESRLRRDFFWGRVIPVTSKLALQWLPCQAPGVIGSALGLVGPVSVYCDWVRWKVGSAASISVLQHIKLSEQIRPWDTLACCWDVKQPTNNNISGHSSPVGPLLFQLCFSVSPPISRFNEMMYAIL